MKKTTALSAVLLIIAVPAMAQKLPNIQEASLRAPAAIKVDGKPAEWNNQFQAYNKATEIYYTISNDNDKLYLAVQATDLNIINKIICAGITLTVNGSGNMKDQEGKAVTFPYLNIDRENYNNVVGYTSAPPINLDKPESMQTDSFMVILNQELTRKAKDIRISGIEEIKDNIISIYNVQGIKAAILSDNNSHLTYELSIPLKYLELSINNPKPFFYNIKLTGFNPDIERPSLSAAARSLRRELRDTYNTDIRNALKGPYGPLLTTLVWPTDFWGEYTLAK